MTTWASDAVACAVCLALVASSAVAQCTPATINPGSVQLIRPHMSPAAVSGILGCAPTDVTVAPETGSTIWVWGIPQPVAIAQGLEYALVAVAFDGAGALFATYTRAPILTRLPGGNAALRVEPSVPPFGNWVPGAFATP